MCACAAPAASLPVAVQIRQNVAPLADSPSLDELSVEPSPEGGSVTLKLVISGHGQTVASGPGDQAPPEPIPAATKPDPLSTSTGVGERHTFYRVRALRARESGGRCRRAAAGTVRRRSAKGGVKSREQHCPNLG